VNFEFKASPTFWRALYRLPLPQQAKAREVFKVFREDPFSPSLKVHKIARLSAAYGRTILAAEIEGDLRVVFYRDGSIIYTVDIGSHDIYKK